MTRDSWLDAHDYLRPVAELAREVDRAAAATATVQASIPEWENYRQDFLAGVNLLQSADVAIALEPGGRSAVALIERLAATRSSGWLAAETRALHAELDSDAHAEERIVDFLLGDQNTLTAFPGLTRYFGWAAMRRYLDPVVRAFDDWRDEEKWRRRYCPTCGSLPAMAQLVGQEHGRQRYLSCGCCGTRWQFKRTCCPFCENDSQRLESVTVEGESGLRLDHCASCRGYIKTYDGLGDESLFLSDWSSLHLDVLAADRGLKRLANSLFEFEPAHHE